METPRPSSVRRQVSLLQGFRYGPGQVFRYEALDDVPFVIHDAVDAEVQIGAVKLEKLAKQLLKFGLIIGHACSPLRYMVSACNLINVL
ncbi:MAG TPA: hypothetical protein PLX02_12555 [Syntrophorhabdaceae bacterium]|nr:hypothetical protein [Syntrophorhabdaceae bacterium]HQM81171.1 hypothetical protein [Syntrophorhabdaceae bacterium]HQM82443.1 hypothetical protein [Syntrophorhabdaceae bacterium]